MARIDPTAAERVSRDRARKITEGYRRISSLWLTPEAARALEDLEARTGEKPTAIINRLILLNSNQEAT